jgi:hypothetical protein
VVGSSPLYRKLSIAPLLNPPTHSAKYPTIHPPKCQLLLSFINIGCGW